MAEGEFEPIETLTNGPLKAWNMDYTAKLRSMDEDPAHDGAVASWIIQAPWAHPIWNSYWLHVTHLRPIDRGDKGIFEPTFYLEGATHELWLYALNPEFRAEDIARTVEPFGSCLTPINFAAQLKLDSDAAAAELARKTADDVLRMRLNPDTDFIRQWAERFGANMVKGGL